MAEMKKLLKNRLFAAFCFAVIILLSVFLGGFRSVKQIEKKAYNAYYSDSGYGDASDDMRKMSRYASMLAVICEAAGSASPNFSACADEFDKTVGDPYIDADLYEDLFEDATLSYNLIINNPNAQEQHKLSAKQYYYEIDAIMRRLANNTGYNELAATYNKALQSFPVSLLLKNSKPMIVFD